MPRAAMWVAMGSDAAPRARFRRLLRSSHDSSLEEAVSSEPVSESQISLLAGKIQARRASAASKKRSRTKYLEANSLRIGTGNFLCPCRELNRGDQGNFRPDQGIPLSPAVLGGLFLRLPINPILP